MKKRYLFTLPIAAALVLSACGKKEKYAGEWRDLCANNLFLLDGAKLQWALEKKKRDDDLPAESDIIDYLKINQMPVCIAGGHYSLNTVGTPPTCSIASHELVKGHNPIR